MNWYAFVKILTDDIVVNIELDNQWLGSVMRQAIIWSNTDPVLRRRR